MTSTRSTADRRGERDRQASASPRPAGWQIGDKRAVPTLMKIMTTSADDQDFLLNQKSALALAEFCDLQPALLQVELRGIFQEVARRWCVGQPAVDPLIELLQEKNPEIQEMAKKLKFEDRRLVRNHISV